MSRQKDLSAESRALRASTAERLEAIVEAAERAAEGVIDDAEAQARAYLAEARERADREVGKRIGALAEVTETLLQEAAALRRQAERLHDALEEAKAKIAAAAPADDEGPSRRGHLTAVAPVAEEAEEAAPAAEMPADDWDSERGGAPAGARLLATQMAVSGNSREEIDQRLRNGFGIADTTAILDAILGPEE